MLRLGIKTGSVYSSQFFLPVYFFSSVRYLASVLGIAEKRNAYRILIGKLEGNPKSTAWKT